MAAVAVKYGQPSIEEVHRGDKLIGAEGRDAAGLAMGVVVDALRGAPGTEHTLVVERHGQRFTVRAKTLRAA